MRKLLTLFTFMLVVSWCTAQTYINTYPYVENFDAIAFDNTSFAPGNEPFPVATNGLFVNNWQNVQADAATQDWYGRSTATGSSNTGPTADHTGGGRYIFVEDGAGNHSDITLESPFFDLTGLTGGYEIAYWVHSQTTSTTDNEMYVELWTSSTNTWTQVDSISDLSSTNLWFERIIDVTSYVGDTIQVRFIVDNSTTSFQHDIAIDDFSLYSTALTASITSVVDNTCGGGLQGSITTSTSLGTPPYTYTWSGGVSTTGTATGLAAGVYTVTVQDAGGDSIILSDTVIDLQTQIQASLSQVAATSPCIGDGSAFIVADSGGTPNVSYVPCMVAGPVCTSVTYDTVGNGTVNNTSTGYPAPFGNWYWGARHQMIWRASELSAAGLQAGEQISSMGFDIASMNGTSSYTNVQIQISCTNDSDLAGGYITGLQQAKAPGPYTVSTGWNDVDFDNAFTWDGASNVVIEFCFNNTGFTNNPIYNMTNVGYTSVRYYRADISTVCSNTTSTTGTSNNRPNVRFGKCQQVANPYDYTWSTGAMGDSISGLVEGTYTVTITDAIGCTGVDSISVGGPAALMAGMSGIDPSCTGDSDGIISSTPIGGAAGTVSPVVVISEVDPGSPDFIEITVTSASPIDLTGWKVGTSNSYTVINTANTMSWNLSGTYAPGTVQYREDATGANYWGNNLFYNSGSPGWVVILDDQGNVHDFMAWGWGASDIAAMNPTITGTAFTVGAEWSGAGINSTCANSFTRTGTSDNNDVSDWSCATTTKGTLNTGLNIVGGVGTGYSFVWSTGDTTASTSGQVAGTYTVTVTDASGCTVVDSFSITDPAVLVASAMGQDANCFGQADAEVYASATGGTAPYNWMWSSTDTTDTVTGLLAGTYTLTVTDDNGCTSIDSVTTIEPAALGLTVTATDLFCFEDTSGSTFAQGSGGVQIAVCGPTADVCGTANTDTLGFGTGTNTGTGYPAPFGNWYWGARHQFLWTAAELSAAGIQPGKISSMAFNVASFGTGSPSYNNITIKAKCTSASSMNAWETGLSTIYSASTYTATVGWNTFNFDSAYFWDGSSNFVIEFCFNNSGFTNNLLTTQTNVGFTASRYYRADNANVCTNTNSTTGTSFNRPNVVFGHCAGGSYNFAWNTGATSSLNAALQVGTYTVTMTDANGCTIVDSATVAQPDSFDLTLTTTDVFCFGDANGTATASLTGGTMPYVFNWSNFVTDSGVTTSVDTGLVSGTFILTVTDSNACELVTLVPIGTPTQVTTSNTVTDVSCFGLADGAATVAGAGGNPGYQYAWPGGATGAVQTGLVAGTYDVSVTDSTGCQEVSTVTIAQPAEIIISTTSTDVTCAGGNDGNATVSSTGGVGGFSFSWMPGGLSGDSVSSLSAGTYTVTAQDSSGCTNTQQVTLVDLNPLPVVNLGNDTAICDGETLNLDAGTPGSAYVWCDGSTGQTLGLTAAGTCGVTVTDINGCVNSDDITLSINPLPVPGIQGPVDTICEGPGNTYLIIADPGFVSYVWSDFSFGTTLTAFSPGDYTVTVTDANGCEGEQTLTLVSDPCVGIPQLGLDASISYFPNPTDGLLNIVIEGLEGSDITLEVMNLQGQIVRTRQFNNVPSTLNGQLNLSDEAQGIYMIRLISGGKSVVHRVSVK